jgi:hypothetical protein
MKIDIPTDLKLDQMNLARYIVENHSNLTKVGLFIGNKYVASRTFSPNQLHKKAIDKLYREFRSYYELLGWYILEILTEQKKG